MNTSAYNLLMTSRGRVFLVAIALLFIVGVAGIGHVYGEHITYGAMQDRDSAIRQLETKSQRLQLERKDQAAQVSALRAQVDGLQAQLNAIIPSKICTTSTPTNLCLWRMVILAIGLVGGPLSNGVNININGKPQFAVVGDVIHVSPDPSTACDVKIQSFDMFQAQFTASCGPSKTE